MSEIPAALSFVIPARNEASAIVGVVEDCLAFAATCVPACEVVVVDDGSSDATASLVEAVARRRPEVRLLRHAERQGIAATTHAGLLAASHDVICYLDGDGQFDATDFGPLIAALDRADFIVGYRVRRAERGARTWGSLAYNLCTRVAGVPVHDVNCGFRVLTRRAFRAVAPQVVSRTSFYFAELTLRLSDAGARVAEVPIGHRPRRGGRPSGARARVVAEQFFELARFLARRRAARGPRA